MRAVRRIADDPRLGALTVLLVAMAVYLPRLGADGLAGTEGHRVIPGWELLDRLGAPTASGGELGTPTLPGGELGTPTVPGGEAQGAHDHQPARPEPTTQRSHGSDQADPSSEIRSAAPPRDGGATRASLAAPTMFDRLYLRKPPGMMWAEAASAAVFGRTEWAARFVGAASSIALAMVCWGFGWRWFGARAGLTAGVALALAPWLWQSGRSAEIEPLHNLWVALAAFCAIDLLLGTPTVPGGRNWKGTRRGGSARSAWLAPTLAAAGLTLAIAGAAAAKGPAGAPVVGTAILGAVLVAMRAGAGSLVALAWRATFLVLALAAAGAAIAAVWLAMQAAARAPGADPVAQSAAEFLWGGPVLEILTLPVAALVAALPLTLALPQAWAEPGGASGGDMGGPPLRVGSPAMGGPPLRGGSPVPEGHAPVATGQPAEPAQAVESAPGVGTPQRGGARDVGHAPPGRDGDAGDPSGHGPPGRWGYPKAYPVALALGWATLLAIAIYTLIGVSNVRYVMPVAPLMAPLVGWAVVNGAAAREQGGRRSLASVFDRLITRWWWAWTGALLIASQVYIWGIEPSRDTRSGREAGLALGDALPAGAEVWANDLVEAVPETLLYAQRAGEDVQVRWRDVAPGEVPSGVFMVLRSDDDSGEAAEWRAGGALSAPVFEGAVRHYRFVVIQAP